MVLIDAFIDDILDAYEHLYDIAYLCESPLIEQLVANRESGATQQARQLHDLLLNIIDELDPGPRAPISSREWRRHRLLMLRYIDGLTPQAVSDRLSISRRHFYREQKEALEVVANILWGRIVAAPERESSEGRPADTERLELMRVEAARLEAASAGQVQHLTHLQDVLEGVLSLIQVMAERKAIRIDAKLGKNLPDVGRNTAALRHILLGLLSYLIEHQSGGGILIKAFRQNNRLHISLRSVNVPQAATENGEQ